MARSRPQQAAPGAGRSVKSGQENDPAFQVDLLSIILLFACVAATVWALRIYNDNARMPRVPASAYSTDAAIFLHDAPAGLETDVSLDAANVFSTVPQLQYKVDLHGPNALVGRRVLVSLVFTGTREQTDSVYYMSAASDGIQYDHSHMRLAKFVRVQSGDDVTSNEADEDPTGVITKTVYAQVVQKWVTVTSRTTATGLGDPGADDALFVMSSPGVIGDVASGRYDVVLPQIGGNRDRETARDGAISRIVDNDGALYPANPNIVVGSSPLKQSIDVAMAALPAGVQIVQATPERSLYLNDLQWHSDDADAPLAVRLELMRTTAQAAAANWLFWAGVILGFALSALFVVLDRVAPSGILRLLPRPRKGRP